MLFSYSLHWLIELRDIISLPIGQYWRLAAQGRTSGRSNDLEWFASAKADVLQINIEAGC